MKTARIRWWNRASRYSDRGVAQCAGRLPFAEDAIGIIERAYTPGETMGSAFAKVIKDLLAPYGLLLVDPMDRGAAQRSPRR